MRELRAVILFLLATIGLFCLPPSAMHTLRQVALATTYYVQTDGDNGNAGTSPGAANAWADPGYAAGQIATGDIVYVKYGPYTITEDTANVAGGVVAPAYSCVFEGYYSVPGDKAMNGTTFSPPIIDSGSVSPSTNTHIVRFSGTDTSKGLFRYLAVDGNDNGWYGFSTATRSFVSKCVARACLYGFNCGGASKSRAMGCLADSCYTGFYSPTIRCVAKDCSVGFYYDSFTDSIAIGCARGFYLSHYAIATNCVAYDSSVSGFSVNGFASCLTNCISVNSDGYAFDTASGGEDLGLENCWDYSSTSGRCNGTPYWDLDGGTLSEDPFMDSSASDFRLDPDGADYASLTGVVSVYGQADNRDTGAVQHTDPAGGGETSHVWIQ